MREGGRGEEKREQRGANTKIEIRDVSDVFRSAAAREQNRGAMTRAVTPRSDRL